MDTVAAATPTPTTRGRLERAWEQADTSLRRAAVAAALTAWLLAGALSTSISVQCASGIVGMLLAAAALVDLHERRLPNRLLLSAAVIALAGAALAGDPAVLASSLAGGLVAGGSMFVVRLTRGVGMGDVKAAAVVGMSTGSVTLIAAPVAIAVTAVVASGYGVLARRSRVPLGPSLWLGWAVSMFGFSTGWWS